MPTPLPKPTAPPPPTTPLQSGGGTSSGVKEATTTASDVASGGARGTVTPPGTPPVVSNLAGSTPTRPVNPLPPPVSPPSISPPTTQPPLAQSPVTLPPNNPPPLVPPAVPPSNNPVGGPPPVTTVVNPPPKTITSPATTGGASATADASATAGIAPVTPLVAPSSKPASPGISPGGGLRMTPPILDDPQTDKVPPVSPIAPVPKPPPAADFQANQSSTVASAALPIAPSTTPAETEDEKKPVVVATPVVANVAQIAPTKPGEVNTTVGLGTSPTPIPAQSQAKPVTPVVGRPLPGAPQPTPAQTASKPPQTVTALSSVSSNKLPSGAGSPSAKTPADKNAPPTVEFAKPKRSIFTLIPLIIGVVLIGLVGVLVFLFFNRQSATTSNQSPTKSSQSTSPTTGGSTGSNTATSDQKIILQYWGLWEPTDAMSQVIADYSTLKPNVSVQYTKQSHQDYRTRLQTAVASGNGPDIFRYHASWVPMLKTELSLLPSAVMSSAEYQRTFYPTAITQLQVNGTPVGIPLMYEGLELFYNVDAFNTAVMQPPTTWGELRETAKKLTIMEGSTIKRAGIAMGYTSNVDHFSDILALLSLQNGANLADPSGKETVDALTFYTLFAKDDVWDETLPTSTVAFARGDVAMIFAPSWRAHEIKQMNPSLNFATVPVPQLDPNTKVTWSNFWAEGVSSKSKNQKEAWEFLKYLSTKESQQKLYNAESQIRSFGEIYSRVEMASELVSDKVVGAFVADAPKAQGWYMSSFTHDKGINDEIIKYYENAVNAINEGKTAESQVDTLRAGVAQVLLKYQVSPSTTSPASGSTSTSAPSSL